MYKRLLSTFATLALIVLAAPTSADVSDEPTHDVAATPELMRLDAYLLLDRSGSMLTEITAIKNNAATALNSLACPPLGTGTPGTCIADLWGGAGTIGYTGLGGSPYLHAMDIQPSPDFSLLPTSEPSGCCTEPQMLAAGRA